MGLELRQSYPALRATESAWVVVISAIAIYNTLVRYLVAVVGSNNLFLDAEVWQRVGESVLAGTPLYTGTAIDNKPPLWEYINIAATATGQYVHVMYAFTALSNITLGLLLYIWVKQRSDTLTAGLTAALTVSLLPIVGGVIINVRSPAVALLLAGLLAGPIGAGVAIAAAGLICQQVGLAAPIVGVYVYRSASDPCRETLKYTTMVAVVGIGTYLTVAAVWGPSVLEAALTQSIFEASEYVSRPASSSAFVDPIKWASGVSRRISVLLPVLLLGSVYIWRESIAQPQELLKIEYLLIGVFGATLLYQALPYYWLPIIPFLAYIAIKQLLNTVHSEPPRTPMEFR